MGSRPSTVQSALSRPLSPLAPSVKRFHKSIAWSRLRTDVLLSQFFVHEIWSAVHSRILFVGIMFSPRVLQRLRAARSEGLAQRRPFDWKTMRGSPITTRHCTFETSLRISLTRSFGCFVAASIITSRSQECRVSFWIEGSGPKNLNISGPALSTA